MYPTQTDRCPNIEFANVTEKIKISKHDPNNVFAIAINEFHEGLL